MAEQKRGDDAADHAPKHDPAKSKDRTSEGRKQEAPNYDKRVDDGRAVATEDVSSANDE